MKTELTDLELKAQIAILSDDRTRVHGIEAREKDGVIILTGSVPSQKIKRAAASIIRDLRNVGRVENKLEVRQDDVLEKIIN